MIDFYWIGVVFILALVCIWQQIEIAELRDDCLQQKKRLNDLTKIVLSLEGNNVN